MAMLVSATVCDAFNFAIIGTVGPIVQTEYGLTNTQWGLVNLIIRLGAPLSFFIIMLADRFGRRPLITLTVRNLGFGPERYTVIGGLAVLRYAPETSGTTLEEISAELDGKSGA